VPGANVLVVLMISTDTKPAVPETGENETDTPAGRFLPDKPTGWAVPLTRATATVVCVPLPATTVPELCDSARLKAKDCETPEEDVDTVVVLVEDVVLLFVDVALVVDVLVLELVAVDVEDDEDEEDEREDEDKKVDVEDVVEALLLIEVELVVLELLDDVVVEVVEPEAPWIASKTTAQLYVELPKELDDAESAELVAVYSIAFIGAVPPIPREMEDAGVPPIVPRV